MKKLKPIRLDKQTLCNLTVRTAVRTGVGDPDTFCGNELTAETSNGQTCHRRHDTV